MTLQTKRHVEVLADHVLCPKLLLTVVVLPRNLLDSFPAENGVVADERGYVAIGYSVTDGAIDEVREESNAVLEVCIRYLHDAGRKLQDPYFGRLVHFGGRIKETVGWYARIAVD